MNRVNSSSKGLVERNWGLFTFKVIAWGEGGRKGGKERREKGRRGERREGEEGKHHKVVCFPVLTYPLTNSNDLACKVELLVVKVRSINVLKRREEEGKEERGGGEGGERRRGGEEGRGGGERRRGGEEGRRKNTKKEGRREECLVLAAVTNTCVHVCTHCVHSKALVDLLWVSGQAVLGQSNHVALAVETTTFLVSEYRYEPTSEWHSVKAETCDYTTPWT